MFLLFARRQAGRIQISYLIVNVGDRSKETQNIHFQTTISFNYFHPIIYTKLF